MWQLWLLKYVNDGWKSTTEDLRNYIFFHYFVTYLYYNMFVVFRLQTRPVPGAL